MQRKIMLIALVAVVITFSACTNMSEKNAQDQDTNAIEHKGHNHNDSTVNKTDSLGMKMGGNELDTKKK